MNNISFGTKLTISTVKADNTTSGHRGSCRRANLSELYQTKKDQFTKPQLDNLKAIEKDGLPANIRIEHQRNRTDFEHETIDSFMHMDVLDNKGEVLLTKCIDSRHSSYEIPSVTSIREDMVLRKLGTTDIGLLQGLQPREIKEVYTRVINNYLKDANIEINKLKTLIANSNIQLDELLAKTAKLTKNIV